MAVVRLKEIADFLKITLKGDPNAEITGVGSLVNARPGQLSFIEDAKYAGALVKTSAGALLLREQEAVGVENKHLLITRHPHRDFARVTARWFVNRHLPEPGVHASALVSAEASIGLNCRIGAFVVVESGAEIGDNAVIFPNSYIGCNARVGRDCLFYPSVTVLQECRIGDRVVLHAGVVIGSDGFGFIPDPPQGYVKVPQIGNVVIGDDVEIQANACIDRGALESTAVGKGCKIDNLVHIAHNVMIGEHTVIAAQTGIAGSARIGNWVTFAGQSSSTSHVNIGDEAIITGQAGVSKDVPPKAMVSGSPAQPTMEYHRSLAELNRLAKLRKHIKEMEIRLKALEEKLKAAGE
jgi:UDP-3-O-[3-hydroxymyristoyl] glucosamine N-acyltransferase